MNERLRHVLPLVAWVVALAVTLVVLTAMGAGHLAAPALTEPGSWADWADGRDPVIATAALLRLVVLGLAWYLLAVTIVGAVARVVRLAAVVRVADALSLPVVRRVLQACFGVGLATAVAVSSASPGGVRPDPDPVLAGAGQEVDAPTPPRMRPLPSRESPSPAPRDETAPPSFDPGPPGDEGAPTPTEPAPPPEVTPPDLSPTRAPDAASTVTVRPGDHLWSMAERHLGARMDAAPSDEQVAAYWRRLIDANRDRLVDPANPDLILPGQQFVLPDDPDAGQERT